MPKIVDHKQRREELLEAVTRVIARHGIEGATMRVIAEESGWSTGSLAHYFSDRDDILASALRYSHETIRKRWAEKLTGKRGLAAIRKLVLDNLPLDNLRSTETRLEVVFWGQAINTPELLQVQQIEDDDLYKTMLALVIEGQASGEVDTSLSAELTTERILALIDGLSVHRVLYGSRLSRDDVRAIFDHELQRLRQK